MRKRVNGYSVYYEIEWSQEHAFDRHQATRILPELPGIILLQETHGKQFTPLIFYSCWRSGLRYGLKDFLDPLTTRNHDIIDKLDYDKLYFQYSIIETSSLDIKDILSWLIRNYQPQYNNNMFKGSDRYRSINVKEFFSK